MRALFLITGVALALTGCGNNHQADNTQNADENLTAQSIVSNDVTAIDAVTGDAANMAADVDMNFGAADQNMSSANLDGTKPSRPVRTKASARLDSGTVGNTAVNAE